MHQYLGGNRCFRLVMLNLGNCKSLKHVYGLECISTLEEIDVSGCTSIEDCRIDGMVNSALRKCDVSGSRVGVAYNYRWLEREPAMQVIIWSGDAILPLSNGMAKELLLPRGKYRMVLEATIASRAECIAGIWCIAINYSEMQLTVYAYVKFEVWRGGQLVVEPTSFPTVMGSFNEVHLYTLRREHHVVQLLQLGNEFRGVEHKCIRGFGRAILPACVGEQMLV